MICRLLSDTEGRKGDSLSVERRGLLLDTATAAITFAASLESSDAEMRECVCVCVCVWEKKEITFLAAAVTVRSLDEKETGKRKRKRIRWVGIKIGART